MNALMLIQFEHKNFTLLFIFEFIVIGFPHFLSALLQAACFEKMMMMTNARPNLRM